MKVVLTLTKKQFDVLKDIVNAVSLDTKPVEKVKKSKELKIKENSIDNLQFAGSPKAVGKLKASLKRAGITTIAALKRKNDEQLLKIKGISSGSLATIGNAILSSEL